MNVARRIEIGGVLVLVAGGLLLAVLGGVASALGAELPQGVKAVLSTATDILWWGRLLVVGALTYGVVKVPENS